MLVRRQVVHDHDLLGPQAWTQNLLQIGQKDIAIGGRFDRHHRQQTVEGDGSQ
jgi:hypothetical protein